MDLVDLPIRPRPNLLPNLVHISQSNILLMYRSLPVKLELLLTGIASGAGQQSGVEISGLRGGVGLGFRAVLAMHFG